MRTLNIIMLLLLISTLQIFGQETASGLPQKKNVAILLFDGVQLIDCTGPSEVFAQAGYNVFTLAEKQDTIITNRRLKVLPQYSYASHPVADIILIPGGAVPHQFPKDNPIIQWITATGKNAKYVLSVGNGTFLLASAGLLDEKEATTYAPMISHISMYAPKSKPVYNKRFVKSGNIITTGGLSGAMDAALYLVSLDKSVGRAREVANNMEYNWNPNSGYVRSQLADRQLMNVLDFNPPLANREVIRYEGDENHWICEYKVVRKESFKEFYDQFYFAAIMHRWRQNKERKFMNSIDAKWVFTDVDGRNWMCETKFSLNENTNVTTILINLKRK